MPRYEITCEKRDKSKYVHMLVDTYNDDDIVMQIVSDFSATPKELLDLQIRKNSTRYED